MEKNKTIAEYFDKIQELVNVMRACNDTVTYEHVVNKILRNLPQRFDHVVLGHFAHECWDGEGAKNKPNNEANLAQDESGSEAVMLMAKTSLEVADDSSWYLNFGCSTHMIGKRDWFVKMSESSHGKIRFVDNNSLSAEGIGKVVLRADDGREIMVEDVLYVPGLKANHFSLGQLLQKGFNITMKDNCLSVFDQYEKLILQANLSHNRIFRVGMSAQKHQYFATTVSKTEWIWHH
ncbi:uncharacterized protein LOC124841095 [Vigna umbellata]|uniref:uncharacterized protein LOC124841095 n=1 Tax=Vigna umbellata TaxID=87088 RepID=UPI001F5EAB35|nr:uncharacterized protein LOC124841095 [Vigna umbellata]